MPGWHKGENYKKSYALNKNLGGGVINTCCHEIDLALFFRTSKRSLCQRNKIKNKL